MNENVNVKKNIYNIDIDVKIDVRAGFDRNVRFSGRVVRLSVVRKRYQTAV